VGAGEYDNEFVIPKRKRRRWPIIIAIIIVLIIAAGGITYYVIHQNAAKQEDERRESYRMLDQSIALIQESDVIVVRVDEAVHKRVTIDDVPQLQALLEQIPSAQNSLDAAVTTATKAKDRLSDQDSLAFAQHVLDAATYRQTLLKEGAALIEKDIAAVTSLVLLHEALNYLIEADTAMRNAAGLSNTISEIQQAVELNVFAREKLDQAQNKLTEAQFAFPQAGFGIVFTYINLKRESADLAIAADEALINGDIEAALALNEAFAVKDQEAVQIAAQIPGDPVNLISLAYNQITGEIRERYLHARTQAAESDVFIRDYLGINAQAGVQ